MQYHTELELIPVTRLKKVGAKKAEKLATLGIATVQDLLFHLPLRYQDRSRLTPIGSLRHGDHVVVQGEINYSEVKFGRRRSFLIHLSDGTGAMTIRLFYFNAAQQKSLTKGTTIRCFGEARIFANTAEMIHPEYEKINPQNSPLLEERLTAIYPTTESLHQTSWKDMSEQALTLLIERPDLMPELLPQEICSDYHLMPLMDALAIVHRPPLEVSLDSLSDASHPAIQRLLFEELLAHQLSLRTLRQQQKKLHGIRIATDERAISSFYQQLTFNLTQAQRRVCKDIEQDLQSGRPMMRLVQGDVGSGKTVVAASAAVSVVKSGYQVAIMAPTEILARQHMINLENWMAELEIRCCFLTGKHKGKRRKDILQTIIDGDVDIVIGTHALFQKDVEFKNLALLVIDEQHRFGVHQRMALKEKGGFDKQLPHQMVMTATPIPRTLAMTHYADLDLSIIDELPAGRKPVETVLVADDRRDQVIARVANAISEGRQVYWVCTLIEDSEELQAQAAQTTHEMLKKQMPKVNIGLVHGRIKSDEKNALIQQFKEKQFDLIVATTVIEVGVDVPNASLMIIENPERLGLSQLHQLRGRVGRGDIASYCVLLYSQPLGRQTRERLDIMRASNDGFEIAEKDLELRGAGEILGAKQTGEMQFRIADLVRDKALIDDVRTVADRMLEHYPEYVPLLIKRWINQPEQFVSV